MRKHIKQYFDNPAVDQSKLKLLLGPDPKTFQDPPVIDTAATRFGSLVDCLMTDAAHFDEEYYVMDISYPSDTIKKIVTEYFEIVSEDPTRVGDGLLLEIIKKNAYYPTWRDETKLKKVNEDGSLYLDMLFAAKGKILISKEDSASAQRIVSGLQSTFPDIFMNTNENVEIFFQKDLYFNLGGVECKGLLDILIIDHEHEVVKIIDLKTFYGHPLEFNTAIHTHRYDIQIAFYKEAVCQNYTAPKMIGYSLECYFLVASAAYPDTPILYKVTGELLYIGTHGRDATNVVAEDGTLIHYNTIEGYVDLIAKYQFYQEHGFEKDQRIVENNSRLEMGWSGIV